MIRRFLAAALLALGLAPGAQAQLGLPAGQGQLHPHSAAAYAGPGDVTGVANPVFWVGLRAYNAAYATGSNPAIDVNCNGVSGTTYTIDILANGSLDLATLNADCTSGTTYVSKWYDQTGNGRHFSQATHADQPTLSQNGTACNSVPVCVVFAAGSATELLTATISGTWVQPFSGAEMVRRTGNTSASNVVFADGGNTRDFYASSANGGFDFYAGTVVTGTVNDAPWAASVVVFNGASGAYNLNGSDHASQNMGSGTLLGAGDQWAIGAFSAANFLTGTVLEVGRWGTTSGGGENFSSTVRAALHGNMCAYWSAASC